MSIHFHCRAIEERIQRIRARRYRPQRAILSVLRDFFAVHDDSKGIGRPKWRWRPLGFSFAPPVAGSKGWHFHLLGVRASGAPLNSLPGWNGHFRIEFWSLLHVTRIFVESAETRSCHPPGWHFDFGPKPKWRA